MPEGVAMRRATFALLAGVALATLAISKTLPLPTPEISARLARRGVFPTVEVAFPGGVRVFPGVRYWTLIGFRPLTMDIYLPPRSLAVPTGGFPMVLFIHGGGWEFGNSRKLVPFADFPGVLASIAARGYVVASVNYRLSGEAIWPAQAQDVKAAIKFLRLHAGKYHINSSRFVAWGVSAGGQLAAIADVTCGVQELEPRSRASWFNPASKPGRLLDPKVSDCVQGAVAWYGVFDMATITAQARKAGAMSRDNPDAPEWLLLGCFMDKCTPGQLKSASAVTYVHRNSPPMLLIVGNQDKLVPYEQTLEMARVLKAAGVRHKLIVMPGMNHSLLSTSPEATRKANLAALKATLQFIDHTIGPASRP